MHSLQRPKVFALEPPLHAWEPLGDHGRVLIHGMTLRRERMEDVIRLERTGPYVPPVTFPGLSDVIVTDAVRVRLADLVRELRFRRVELAHVARADWCTEDAAASTPPASLLGGEPEDCVRGLPHDAALAASIEPLWEVVADVDAEIEGRAGTYHAEDYCGQPLVRACWWRGRNFVSEEFRDALLEVAPAFVAFERARRAPRE